MELLTVLGTGNYTPTCYNWQEKQLTTPFVTEALSYFFNPEKVKVLVTPEAKEKHFENLQKAISERFSNIEIIAVDIPSGKSEEEIWQIFDAVVDSVSANSQIIFDITHAFRSIPLFVLLASAFLQKARNVEIKGVYYGAFEVDRNQPPIFDLTPTIKLLDWLTATDTFLNTGSSVELGKLLTNIQQDFYRSGKQKQTELKPTRLKSFGDKIDLISRSLDLIRPLDLIKETTSLKNIPVTRLQDEVGAYAKPFELLLQQIQNDYQQFALPETSDNNLEEELQKQFLILRWYVNKNQNLQAILLGREWIISAFCLLEKIEDYRNKNKRSEIEKQLGLMIGKDGNLAQPITVHIKDSKKLADFWSNLIEYRNDIAHTQMRKNTLSADKIKTFTQTRLIQELSELFPQFIV